MPAYLLVCGWLTLGAPTLLLAQGRTQQPMTAKKNGIENLEGFDARNVLAKKGRR
jgi:hypothetical protein